MAEDSSAQPGSLLTGLASGSRVAGYLLEGLVGAGGMAAVYRARDERLGRVVALKLLAAELTRDEGFRRRFLREARAVAAVDHPHIIPVYQAGEADGVLFIAMRFVAGGDLGEVVRREGRLPSQRAAAFISPVASALDAAHAIGLVHRDVKPANILVDAGPGRPEHVYLSDFGLARGVLSSAGLTRAGQFLGTPDYAAPEQVSGQTVDGRADQYALACVAYTLLACSVLFIRDHPMAALYAHLHEPPPRLTEARPDLPGAVDLVLERALAKAPGDRYPGCGAFADALRQALGVGPYGTAELSRPSTGVGMVPAEPVRQPTLAVRPVAAEQESTVPDADTAGMTMTASLPAAPDSPAPPPVAGRPSAAADPASDAAQAPAPVPAAGPGASAGVAAWTAVVTADRAYYDKVQAEGTADAAKILFPDHYPERRFPLSGTEVHIGRGSATRGIQPEIDLAGPQTDRGLSHLHAKLVAEPDGTWSVIDVGSGNGTLVNGSEIPRGEAVPLGDGDRINLGAWTAITLARG